MIFKIENYIITLLYQKKKKKLMDKISILNICCANVISFYHIY